MSPLRVSQRTSLELLGIPARRYLELLRLHAIPHTRVGQLRLARPDDVLAALERGAAAERDGDGVDGALAVVGLRRVGGER